MGFFKERALGDILGFGDLFKSYYESNKTLSKKVKIAEIKMKKKKIKKKKKKEKKNELSLL